MQLTIFAWIRPKSSVFGTYIHVTNWHLDSCLVWFKEIMYKFTKIFLSLPLVRQEWVEEKTSSMIPELLSQFTLLAFPSQSILSFDVKSCWAQFDENLAVYYVVPNNSIFCLDFHGLPMDWPKNIFFLYCSMNSTNNSTMNSVHSINEE